MNALCTRAALAVLLLAAAAIPAAAQSDILLRLRSGSPAGDRFRVDSAGGVVAIGQLGIGIIPASGCGYRMMWYPFRGAFRAGTTDDGGTCTYWDDANIGFYSWAGGSLSRATGFASFAFGDQVTVTGTDAAAFGGSNTVSGTVGFAAGANHNCTGFACVTMGYNNTATGQGSTAIGYRATADANYSTAIGYRASTNGRAGAFVISDASTTDSTEASANNQFRARFAGGYRLYTNSSQTVGVSLSGGGNSWASISDRNRKEAFAAVDGEDVLARIRRIPVSEWSFIGDETGVRHVGPMAQDWHAAFPLNGDRLAIDQADFDGVNLAAIQALERRTTEQADEIATLRGELDAVRARNAALEARLARLEAMLSAAP